MMKYGLQLNDVLSATKGQLINSPLVSEFETIGTDTRQSLKNQLFIALKGDQFDAHDFLKKALAAGATGLLIHRWSSNWDEFKSKITIIIVPDTLIALQQLGHFHRVQWNKKIIGITGSNGKTTTKEFCAQILSPYLKTHFNEGSFNNHWGLPLTLLGLRPEHEIAICEMGMNHPGEIQQLVVLAEPNIVGVTMVGRAHLEGLGTIEAVAAAKQEILTSPNPRLECGIFNLDNLWTEKMKSHFDQTGKPSISFSSQNKNADIFLSISSMNLEGMTLEGRIEQTMNRVFVPVFGIQNLTNLMFAIAAGLAAGLSPEQIWKALPHCRTSWGRNQKIHDPLSGSDILFDGYNANPDSQKALLENLKLLPKDRPLVGIFGEMRELGEQSEELHEELGHIVSQVGFKKIYFVGSKGASFKKGFGPSTNPPLIYDDVTEDLVHQLKGDLKEKPLMTIKGSRGVRLERLLKGLNISNGKS